LHPDSCIYIYFAMNVTTHSRVTLPCLCANLRRSTRAVTQLYDQALRPLGLRATQFTILQVLERTGEITQGELGELLATDSTTLTRTLKIMRRNGWIAERRGQDRRQRRLRLAKAGRAQLVRATPAWAGLQADLARMLGEKPWQALFTLTGELTSLATTQGDSL
jgi:DNA-binding MarR family transcriptional regulator